MKRNNIYLSLVLIFLISQNLKADVWVGFKKDQNNKTKSTKAVAASCSPATGATYLELNNVKTLIQTGGDMWWDLNSNPKYEIPKGSGKHSNFASAIWIGGTDVNGQLRLAGVRYRAGGTDYWTGPLIASGDEISSVTADICRKYDRHFAITKKEVKDFRAYFAAKAAGEEVDPDYTVPLSITEWPAHGPIEYGAYDWNLAPFRDLNGNGSYEPELGEYPRYEFADDIMPCGTAKDQIVPRLYGDATLWWVYNDNGNIHTETGGQAIGMELRGQAFAFSSNDELNNMTFYNFEIINRSTYTLKNTYFAVFTDADLGDAADDYCGCDVAKGLGFIYNADPMDGDGTERSYGQYPPAIGVDFFEGPFMDPSDNHQDRPSSYILDDNFKPTNELDPNGIPATWYNGSINGLNFGDGVVDNERWGMRRFIYYNNEQGGANTDPDIAIEYYNYLKGIWKDNKKLKYGGNGYNGTGVTNLDADFMFPGLSDETNWGTAGVEPADKDWTGANSDTPNDKRFVHSAGPFTLMPGAINYITTGVVWARSYTSTPYNSVKLVIQADEKAQKLFDNCFKTVDGPDAPELDIIETDNKFIVNIWNKKGSNNYQATPEDYLEKGLFIVCPEDDQNCNDIYKFEGYIVYQLKDKSISVNDISNTDLAKVVYQCDINNEIGNIMNYEYNSLLQASEPKQKVIATNNGIGHSFTITQDLFSSSSNTSLVNYKTYYYVAIAYAYNNYKTYDPLDPNALDGQKEPFLAGRNNIKIFSCIPHPIEQNEGGTSLNTSYGATLKVSQVDGYGNGENVLELEDETINRILANKSTQRIDSLNFKTGYSPIKIKVIDPLNVKETDFQLKFYDVTPADYSNSTVQYTKNGYIGDSKWYIVPLNTWSEKTYDTTWADINHTVIDEIIPVYGYDTIYSDKMISIKNEQLIMYNSTKYGISVEINQTKIPGEGRSENKNGFLESSIEFSNSNNWLGFVQDIDNAYNEKLNWIRSGKYKAGNKTTPFDDYQKDAYYDESEYYEKILNGSWAPGALVADEKVPSKPDVSDINLAESDGYFHYDEGLMPENLWKNDLLFSGIYYRYASVDIVITKDKSKWTRCPIIETCNNNYIPTSTGTYVLANVKGGNSIGNKLKFTLRDSKSVDKNGNSSTSWAPDYTNEDSPNFIGAYGMGWFPGYAIDIETGERLNIMFGEDSHFSNQNSRDMMWNPTAEVATNLFFSTGGNTGELIKGGRHYIYVMQRNSIKEESTKSYRSTGYDYGKSIYDKLVLADSATLYTKRNYYIESVMKNAMWVSMPILKEAATTTSDPYSFIKSDVKVKIRMANPYRKNIMSYSFKYDSLYSVYHYIGGYLEVDTIMKYSNKLARNGNLPMYYFSTKGLSASTDVTEIATSEMDKINVVPNPYYAFNNYETSPVDHKIKFTNLPNNCTIRIYNVGGNLIRTLKKDNNLTYMDWDLKNEYGISISGGVYIIHIDAPGVGEKILKWFGSLRPIDINSF